jgi:hypothetical protein
VGPQGQPSSLSPSGMAILYLRDDGIQAIGPPGVVHRVRVQDAPGGRGQVRGRRMVGVGCPPTTHQGPRPRLGIVAGVMMPLTSCWMILEESETVTAEPMGTGKAGPQPAFKCFCFVLFLRQGLPMYPRFPWNSILLPQLSEYWDSRYRSLRPTVLGFSILIK